MFFISRRFSNVCNKYKVQKYKVIIAGNLSWEDSVLALGLIGLPLTTYQLISLSAYQLPEY